MRNRPESTEPTLEALVEQAKAGDRRALEQLIRRIQDSIYGLALRMLYHPADAEDASQEILIQIITHLDRFEGRSSFLTWAYRVASNHLLNTRKRRAEKMNLSFEYFSQGIARNRPSAEAGALSEGERNLLAKEVKLVCTQAMLLSLRRDIRLAFILGEIFGASSQEGADILDITPETFRQRLSRGRKQIRDFMITKCSLVVPGNPCNCARLIERLVDMKWLDPSNPLFLNHPCQCHQTAGAEHPMKELDEFGRITAIFRSHPDYSAPESFVDIVKELVDSGHFQLFTAH